MGKIQFSFFTSVWLPSLQPLGLIREWIRTHSLWTGLRFVSTIFIEIEQLSIKSSISWSLGFFWVEKILQKATIKMSSFSIPFLVCLLPSLGRRDMLSTDCFNKCGRQNKLRFWVSNGDVNGTLSECELLLLYASNSELKGFAASNLRTSLIVKIITNHPIIIQVCYRNGWFTLPFDKKKTNSLKRSNYWLISDARPSVGI